MNPTDVAPRLVHDTVSGDQTVVDSCVWTGACIGNLRVERGGFVLLAGICCGDVVVESGGRVDIPGMVVGSVIVKGGEARVSGLVTQSVRKSIGDVFIASGARLGKQGLRKTWRLHVLSRAPGYRPASQ